MGRATHGHQWIHASAVVALEYKATLGLAIPNKAMATNTTKPTGEGAALGLRSCGVSPSHRFSRIDATVMTAVVFEYSDSKK